MLPVLALALLVALAFFSPRWLFFLQDRKQCSDFVLSEREKVDAAALSTNYETSFNRRMINFAQDLTAQTNFFVASQELYDYDTLRQFLDSNELMDDYYDPLSDLMLIRDEGFSYDIGCWKQYIIYSDDYTKGVYFILWYVELQNADSGETAYKLLMEADSGELYALWSARGTQWTGASQAIAAGKALSDDTTISLNTFLGLDRYRSYFSVWSGLFYYFGGLRENGFDNKMAYYDVYLEEIWSWTDSHQLVEAAVPSYGDEAALAQLRETLLMVHQAVLNRLWVNVADENGENAAADAWAGLDGENEEDSGWEVLERCPPVAMPESWNRLECVFPYGNSSLCFSIQLSDVLRYPWFSHDITIGFDEIYSLIPEFQE